MTLLVEGRGLALVRGGRLLFEGLDLALSPGEGLCLIGPNGCGKSSLIRLLAGLLRPNAGSVTCESKIAIADENLALDRELSLRRALRQWVPNYPLDCALEIMGIEHLANTAVRLLSAGQARKARLARVIASDARIWMLDEPLNGLDSDGVERLLLVMSSHRRSGGAVLAASHIALGNDWRTLEVGK